MSEEFEPRFPSITDAAEVFASVSPFTLVNSREGLYVTITGDNFHEAIRGNLSPMIDAWRKEVMLQGYGLYVQIIRFRHDPDEAGIFLTYDQIIGSRRVAHVTWASVVALMEKIKKASNPS